MRLSLAGALLSVCLLSGCQTPPAPAALNVDAVPAHVAAPVATPAGPSALKVPAAWECLVSKAPFTCLSLHPIDDRLCLVLGSEPSPGGEMSNEVGLLDCSRGLLWHERAMGTDGTGPTVRTLRFLGMTTDTVMLSFDDPDPAATVYDYGRGSVGINLKDGAVRWTSERYRAAYDTVGHLLELPAGDTAYDFLSTEQSSGPDFLELLCVRARRLEDGKLLWNTLLGDVRDVLDAATTPKVLICCTSKDAGYAVRRSDGRLLHHWQQNGRGWLDGDHYWYAADDGLHRLNVATFNDRRLGGESAEGLGVARRGNDVLFLDHRGTVVFVDAGALSVHATMSLPQEYGIWTLAADHQLPRYIPWASDDSLSALDLDNHRVLWTRELTRHFVPYRVEQVGNRFVLIGRDSVSVFDGDTGQITAARHMPGTTEDPPIARAGNAIWAASGSKVLVLGVPALNLLHTNAPGWRPEDVTAKFRPH
ncbi:MAG: PQQ-binding-like beta-propeller repeat protein [Candidatus Xenobia bacterium]